MKKHISALVLLLLNRHAFAMENAHAAKRYAYFRFESCYEDEDKKLKKKYVCIPSDILEDIGIRGWVELPGISDASETDRFIFRQPQANPMVELSDASILSLVAAKKQMIKKRRLGIAPSLAVRLMHTADYLNVDEKLIKKLALIATEEITDDDVQGCAIADLHIVSVRSLIARGKLSSFDPERYIADKKILNLAGLGLRNIVGLEQMSPFIGTVEILNLADNNLQRVSRKSITKIIELFPELKVLDLSNNKINKIDEFAFDKLPSRCKVYLRDNKLASVPAECGRSLRNGVVDLVGDVQYSMDTLSVLQKVFKKRIIVTPSQLFGQEAMCDECNRTALQGAKEEEIYLSACCNKFFCQDCAIAVQSKDILVVNGLDLRPISHCRQCKQQKIIFKNFQEVTSASHASRNR